MQVFVGRGCSKKAIERGLGLSPGLRLGQIAETIKTTACKVTRETLAGIIADEMAIGTINHKSRPHA